MNDVLTMEQLLLYSLIMVHMESQFPLLPPCSPNSMRAATLLFVRRN